MKQVIFKRLSIQNFLSVGSTPVVLDLVKGINVITGINLDKEGSKNGVGKSAICDAVNFCLFGETLRELKKEHIINRLSRGPCKVILAFDVIENNNVTSYVLMRGIEPTTIQLLQLGLPNPDITASSIPKTTEYICKLINCSPEVFQQSILMALNTTLPFMAQKKVDKRKFIEGILKLGVFSDMLLEARQEHGEYKKEYDSEQNIFNELETVLKKYIDQQNTLDETRKQKVIMLQKRIADNENEIQILRTKIVSIDTTEIQTLKDNLKLLEAKEKEYSEARNNIHAEVASLSMQLTSNMMALEELNLIGLTCDKCKRPFTDKDIGELSRRKKELQDIIESLTKQLEEIKIKQLNFKELSEKCRTGITKFNNRLHEIALIEKGNENTNNQILQIQATNKQTQRDIEDTQNEHSDFKQLIDETISRKSAIQTRLDVLSKKIEILETAKFVVSEEGVKSFIVKKILRLLNARLAVYLSKLDANCRCTFNEYFEETIIDDKGQECSYHNFSGGEKKRIDLAMLFTFQDIRRLQGDVAINISMYDELLDSSLDGKGIECVMAVLKEKVERFNEAIYIITHNNFALNTTVNQTIQLVKQNGITKMVT